MAKVKDLRKIASRVRQKLGPCTHGVCIPWAIEVQKTLMAHGYKALHTWGRLPMDGFYSDPSMARPGGPVTFIDSLGPDDWNPHNWVEVGNLIVDISGDQFNSLLRPRNRIPSIHVTKKTSRLGRRYQAVQRERIPLGEWEDLL